jgi:hypothetical protein
LVISARVKPPTYGFWVPDEAVYVERGRKSILTVLQAEHAVVCAELEARVSEHGVADFGRIDPNHVTTAVNDLMHADLLARVTSATRGGRKIPIVFRTDPGARVKSVQSAAARKRLLSGRYLGWASGTEKTPGVIGPAMEHSVHASLLAAAPAHGFRVENVDTGQTSSLMGAEMPKPLGPLDNAFSFADPETRSWSAVPVEVKSLRDWLFPYHPRGVSAPGEGGRAV